MSKLVTYSRRKRRSPSNDAAEEEEEKGEEVLQQRKPPSLRISPISHKYKQYFLDCGQNDFSYSTCKTCGLLYARGNRKNDKLHAVFHKRYVQEVLFKGWQKERLVVKHEKDDERIILVLHTDPLQHQLKVYLYISSKRVVGCAVTEPISQAYPVLSEMESTATTKGSMKSSDVQNNINQPDLLCCVTSGLLSNGEGYQYGGKREWLKCCKSAGDEGSQSQQKDDVERASKRGSKTIVFGDVKFHRESATLKHLLICLPSVPRIPLPRSAGLGDCG